jgi:hypothetical protein
MDSGVTISESRGHYLQLSGWIPNCRDTISGRGHHIVRLSIIDMVSPEFRNSDVTDSAVASRDHKTGEKLAGEMTPSNLIRSHRGLPRARRAEMDRQPKHQKPGLTPRSRHYWAAELGLST